MKRSLWLVLMLGVSVACDDAPTEDAPTDEAPQNENVADAPTDEAPADETPPEGSIGSVVAVVGDTTMTRGEESVDIAAGTWVMPGDSVKTGADGKAEVKLGGGSVLRVGPDSEVEIKDFQKSDEKRSGTIKVLAGKFWMNVLKWTGEPDKSFVEVETPNAVAGIRGTTLWGDTERDVICSLEGLVEVKSTQEAAPTKGKKRKKKKGRKGKKGKAAAADGPVKLEAGSCASEMSKGLTTPLTPKPEQVEEYLAEVMIEGAGGGDDGGGDEGGDEGDGADDAANKDDEEGGE